MVSLLIWTDELDRQHFVAVEVQSEEELTTKKGREVLQKLGVIQPPTEQPSSRRAAFYRKEPIWGWATIEAYIPS